MTSTASTPHAPALPAAPSSDNVPAPRAASRRRDDSLDGIKAFASLAVVVLHAGAAVVRAPDAHSTGWWAAELINATTRWSVPLFVMVSGVLLLGGPRVLSPLDFYRQRLVRILVPLAFWSAIYLVYREFTQENFTPRDVVYSIVTGRPYYHLWYLYMIVGIYLAAPFLKQLTDQLPTATIGWLALAILAWAALDVGMPYQSRTFFAKAIPYVGYLLAGLWLHRRPPHVSSVWLLLGVVGCMLADAALTGVLAPRFGLTGVTVMEDFLNPLVIGMSLGLFVVMSRVKSVPALVKQLSFVSLGIYTIHPLMLDALRVAGLTGSWMHPLVGIPVTASLAFLMSSLAAWALAQLPLLRRTVC